MPHNNAALKKDEFETICALLYDVSGICIPTHKLQMVENRISKRIKELGMELYSEYISFLKQPKNADEIVNLINSLTTNVTHFFRESHHFTHLTVEIIKILSTTPATRLRIWSAGCSIGAEPYSAAMAIAEMMRKNKVLSADIKILATDIDTIALSRCRLGEYAERLMKGVSPAQLKSFFTAYEQNGERIFTVTPDLRKMIAFNHLNLNDPKWPMSGPFDFIFCRNVLIYFDREKQHEYVTKMLNLIRPGGFLYLGHSEHMAISGQQIESLGQTIYRKPPA